MSAATSESLLALYDDAPLNARYWVTFTVMCAVTLLDFFDFFLIAFVMSQIGPEWKLTYGEGALILYSAGLGAILGAIIWGALGDRFGRKYVIWFSILGALRAGGYAGWIVVEQDVLPRDPAAYQVASAQQQANREYLRQRGW